MFLFYVLSFFKKRDTIQGGTLFKGEHYLRKYDMYISKLIIALKQGNNFMNMYNIQMSVHHKLPISDFQSEFSVSKSS